MSQILQSIVVPQDFTTLLCYTCKLFADSALPYLPHPDHSTEDLPVPGTLFWLHLGGFLNLGEATHCSVLPLQGSECHLKCHLKCHLFQRLPDFMKTRGHPQKALGNILSLGEAVHMGFFVFFVVVFFWMLRMIVEVTRARLQWCSELL